MTITKTSIDIWKYSYSEAQFQNICGNRLEMEICGFVQDLPQFTIQNALIMWESWDDSFESLKLKPKKKNVFDKLHQIFMFPTSNLRSERFHRKNSASIELICQWNNLVYFFTSRPNNLLIFCSFSRSLPRSKHKCHLNLKYQFTLNVNNKNNDSRHRSHTFAHIQQENKTKRREEKSCLAIYFNKWIHFNENGSDKTPKKEKSSIGQAHARKKNIISTASKRRQNEKRTRRRERKSN